ncbi:ATP-dependent 3'-5' DNA helicase [Massospora cicadina]|nr:ATP-dependent 3'-5' DNA helicase [Massospora cicadina]
MGDSDHETKRKYKPRPQRERWQVRALQDIPNGSKASGPRSKRGSGTQSEGCISNPSKGRFTPDDIQLPPGLARLEKLFNALCTVLGLLESKLQAGPNHTKAFKPWGLATSFPAMAASVAQVTGEKLELMDLAAMHELAPRLTAIESRVALAAYDPQFDHDWSYSEATGLSTGKAYMHVSRPHVVYKSALEDEPGKEINVYFLLMPMTPSTPGRRKKPGRRAKVDLVATTYSRQLGFRGACCEYIKAQASGMDPSLKLRLDARRHLPTSVFVAPGACPEVQAMVAKGALSSVVSALFKAPFFMGQVDFRHGVEHIPPRLPTFQRLSSALHPHVAQLLPETGLYSHQAASLDALCAGAGVAVNTSTASGKSLIYQLAILEELVRNGGRALIVAPTKALAQDQLTRFRRLLARSPALAWVEINPYDGDTPAETRAAVRETSHIILTNPDMLHHGILPQCTAAWGPFLARLRVLVLDEMHVYRGAFGQHTSLVVRRLLRLAGSPKVVGCSATLSNPAEHLSRLTGLPGDALVEISDDGSPGGPKRIFLWNSSRCGRPMATDGVEVLAHFLLAGARTLAFCSSRGLCETLHSQMKAYLELRCPPAAAASYLSRVESYRGGYSSQDRLEVERKLSCGSLALVIATNALELGIDVGGLEVVVSVGTLAEVACLQQQMGRAGRQGDDSVMLILHAQALGEGSDQKNLLKSVAGRVPHLTLLPETLDPCLLELHLQCAANERPIIPPVDQRWFGPQLDPICAAYLEPDGEQVVNALSVNLAQAYICARQYRYDPWRRIMLRDTAGALAFRLIDASQAPHQVLEEVELARAIHSVYEGAIHLHRGRRFLIREVVPKTRSAWLVDASDSLHQTTPLRHTVLSSGATLASRQIAERPSQLAHFGQVNLNHRFAGLKRIHPRTREVLEEIRYPPHRDTSILVRAPCVWLDLELAHPSAAHAISHLLVRAIHTTFGPLARGIVSACCHLTPDAAYNSLARRVYLYPGGEPHHPLLSDPHAGVFSQLRTLLRAAYSLLCGCPCLDGCPQCILNPACGYLRRSSSLGEIRSETLRHLEPLSEL